MMSAQGGRVLHDRGSEGTRGQRIGRVLVSFSERIEERNTQPYAPYIFFLYMLPKNQR